MKKSKLSGSSIQNNVIPIIQGIFVLILFILNVLGVIYAFGTYNSITQTSYPNATTISTKLITEFNQTLYNQITKKRANYPLYTSNSPDPKFTFNEVFGR